MKIRRLLVKTNRTLKKWEKKLGINEPDLPHYTHGPGAANFTYKEVSKYLLNLQKSTRKYYSLVFVAGCLGLLLSFILFIILIWSDWDNAFKIKQYPAVIFSVVTMAFSQIEMQMSRKELYRNLNKIRSAGVNLADANNLDVYYKKWTWEEFRNLFNEGK